MYKTVSWNTGSAATRYRLKNKNKIKATSGKPQATSGKPTPGRGWEKSFKQNNA